MNRSLYRYRAWPLGYVNISLELNRWMKRIRLPRTPLRRRYAQLVHAFHVLQGTCDRTAVIYAMQTLLHGWINNVEHRTSPNVLYVRGKVADLRISIRRSMEII